MSAGVAAAIHKGRLRLMRNDRGQARRQREYDAGHEKHLLHGRLPPCQQPAPAQA